MSKILTVFKFELGNYFKNKSFVISTVLITIVCALVMFAPRVIDAFSGSDDTEVADGADDERDKIAVYDPNSVMIDEYFKEMFPDTDVTKTTSKDELEKLVKADDVLCGFVINDERSYDYIVNNSSMEDGGEMMFTEYMQLLIKVRYCAENNLNMDEFMEVSYPEMKVGNVVLGKDGSANYWYCYILVIIVFMLIIMYGTSIATGVANEKGNRSMEILVTTASSNHLLFGKVFAGVVASLAQVGCIGLGLLGGFQLNKEYWDGIVASMLDIPGNVLITFAVFGLGGFLVFMFMYGAVGALVSKVEDVNKSAGSVQMIIMIVYFIVLFNLQNIDCTLIKVCSFIPFSSYSAMFARVAMGHVEMWEIIVSAVILYATVIAIGFLGGKIFRSSTLRYGNPISLKNALKNLRKENN